jgi:hypothetical protein
MKLVKDTTFIMDSMNLRFLHTFHYSPSLSPVDVVISSNNIVKFVYFR